MKKLSMIITILISISFNLLAFDNYEPGVILLKVKDPVNVKISNTRVINGSAEFQNILNKYGIATSRKLPFITERTDGSYRIEFPPNTDLKALKTELLTCPDVRYINFNYYATYCAIPNDTYWSDQWALQKIQMSLAWDITKGDQSILVGVLDCGIKYDHEDLSDNIWINEAEASGSPNVDDDGNGYIDDLHGWDFGIPDNNPMDDGGHPDNPYHGTRVAGVIAAKTYNSLGIAGIAGGWQSQPGVRLVALKLANQAGEIVIERIRNALLYLAWLSNHGHTVIANMSLSIK